MAVTTQKIIGKYKLLGLIGQGGMGAVYKAYHPTLKRIIIIKQLTIKKNAMAIERFKREAALMLDFRDERIVQVYDHFKEGTSYYIAMEYVDGIGLDKLIEEKRYLSNEAAILIISEICRGLKYAHDRGVVHRDIKPENILISSSGQVKLTDFGIAKAESEQSGAALTKAGTTLGSPAYMSPEQIFNTKGVDKRADIYSLGVMLYKMVTGQLPYPRDMSPNTIIQIQKGRYVKPKKLNPAISPRIQGVITKAMQPSRTKRYKDLQEILNQFESLTGGFRDKSSIDEAVRHYLKGTEIKLKRRNPLLKKVQSLLPSGRVKIACAACGLVLLLLTGHFSGFFYRVLLPSFFNKVEVRLLVPPQVEPGQNPATFMLYKKNRLGNYQKVLFPLRAISRQNAAGQTRAFYLFHGQYRVDLLYCGLAYSEYLLVKPSRANGNKPLELVYDTADMMQIPVQLEFALTDRVQAVPLEDVQIAVWDQKWVDYNLYKGTRGKNLTAGASYQFQFKKQGYKTDYRTITVPPFYSVSRITVDLEQESAVLTITSRDPSVKVGLNYSRYCYSGRDEKRVVFLGLTFPEQLLRAVQNLGAKEGTERPNAFSRELLLPPGVYELTFQKGKHIEYRKLSLEADRSQTITIDFKADTKKILVTMN